MALVEIPEPSADAVDDGLGPVSVVVEPGLPGWEDDVELVARSVGWLRGDTPALVEVVDDVIDRVDECDLSMLDDTQLRRVAARWETIAARVDAVAARVAGEIERRGHDRDRGFFSTRAVIEHRHRLSRATSTKRTQTMRMFDLLPTWAAAARDGTVGADQVALVARVAANPRIGEALVVHADRLLDDARRLPYQRFEQRVRMFVRLADTGGAASIDERNRDRRDVTLTPLPDGSWRLRGRFSALDGAEINETFAHFIDAEFRSDLHTARENSAHDNADGHDGEPGIAEFPRTEPQRRADALLAMARSAAASPPGRSTPLPTLDVLIDIDTLESIVNGDPVDPARSDDVVCRTRRGHVVPLDDAAAMTLWAHIRRVVCDSAGTVIDLGRRRRLFRGSARDAVTLLHENCLWPGCTIHGIDCESDHARTWKTHGATSPDNGLPLCRRHNLLKERGRYTTHRTDDGNWIFTDPHGRVVE